MARRQPSKLTSHYKLPPSPQLTRYLLRLSKPSLEKLVFDWLKTPICAPDLSPWKGKSWMPNVAVVLEGTHVFAGVRTLVEEGVFDGEKIPTWMTGEEGKSVGTVKGGTILKSAVAAGILEATADTRRGRRKTT